MIRIRADAKKPGAPRAFLCLAELGFLAPTGVGERWLGEAETERGMARPLMRSEKTCQRRSPLSDRFAATSPPFHGGEEPRSCEVATSTVL
ncbi:hypothetical protein CK232_19850 [Mesorhizobium sp. WSM4304]|nr:hypothetical protein CK232_19850 [Mesorhizobium sp. WSM4304]